MGKQGSPRSPRPEPQINDDLSSGTKDYDPSNVGRRMPGGDNHLNSKMLLLHGLRNDSVKYTTCKGSFVGKKHLWLLKDVRSIIFVFALMDFLLLLDSFLVSIFDSMVLQNSSAIRKLPVLKEEHRDAYLMKEKAPVQMYDRLLKLAKGALAEKEFKPELSTLWKEPYRQVAAWKPCADRKVSPSLGKYKKGNGYIVVSANGGLKSINNELLFAMLLLWHLFLMLLLFFQDFFTAMYGMIRANLVIFTKKNILWMY
ncbi:unnamed protein product [Prunus brigantina]